MGRELPIRASDKARPNGPVESSPGHLRPKADALGQGAIKIGGLKGRESWDEVGSQQSSRGLPSNKALLLVAKTAVPASRTFRPHWRPAHWSSDVSFKFELPVRHPVDSQFHVDT